MFLLSPRNFLAYMHSPTSLGMKFSGDVELSFSLGSSVIFLASLKYLSHFSAVSGAKLYPGFCSTFVIEVRILNCYVFPLNERS